MVGVCHGVCMGEAWSPVWWYEELVAPLEDDQLIRGPAL